MRKSAVGMAKSGARAGCGYGSVLAALLTLSVEFALAGTARPVPSVDAPRASLPLEFPWRAWRLFSSNDHLPNNLAYAIAQDETGEVYAGLGDGLARYDGASWERVALPGVRGVHAVGALLLGADHSLWVGTDGVGVFRVRGGNAEPVPGLSAEAGVVYALAAEGESGVWAATDGGLARCDALGCRMFEPLRGKRVREVVRGHGPNGPCLWIGTGGEGLLRIDINAHGEPVLSDFLLDRSDGLPNNYVKPLVQWGGKDGRDLWIGTGRGLARFDGERLVRYTPAVGFPGAVQAILPGRGRDGGLLFVGLRPGGLALIREDGSWGLAGQAEGLPDSAVQHLAYTDMGSSTPLLWVGTVAGGIARADPGRWQLLDERRDIPTRGMVGLGSVRFPDGMETLWLGSARATLRLTQTGWKAIEGIPEDAVVVDMAATADGSLWVAAQTGLWQLNGTVRREYTADNSQLPAVYAGLLAVQSNPLGSDTLWVGTGHGLARWSASEGLLRDDSHPLLQGGPAIRALAFARLGHDAPRTWVGLDEGVLHRDGERWQQAAGDCLDGAHVTTIIGHEGASGGEIWIGTDGPVLRLRTGACERLENVFADGFVEQIGFDHEGRAYLFGTGGAARLDGPGDAPLQSLQVTRYGREDGLVDRNFLVGRGVASDERGRVWVASTAALQVFDPQSESASGSASSLVWESVTEGVQAREIAEGADLPADASPLVFSARLLAFEREEHIRYRVQLVGLQTEPQAWTAENRFEFSRLASGSYEARVWGRDANGVVSGPLLFPFEVLAPWWQRPWALVLGALALVAIGSLYGRWRNRALRMRAMELAQDVAIRTAELADANLMLEEMSRTDALTGLHNRRHALGVLPELAKAQGERRRSGSQRELLLVLIDVDRFKGINDTRGHAVGDLVLQAVATRLRRCVRGTDMLVRWGGEEFLLALGDCESTAVEARLRDVLTTVSDEPVEVPGAPLKISISAGAATYPAQGEADQRPAMLAIEAAIAQADRALYEAKHRGRDRAVLVVDGAEAVAEPSRWTEFGRLA
ncbi:MAG: GGDEF domain-containing protein [Gammaproteobacteria bacterium]|nr:MAG: GGDEF domain-containing protein [Gammaproteobacteria bacterium]